MADTRLQTRIVHFRRPFTLPQVDGVLPPDPGATVAITLGPF